MSYEIGGDPYQPGTATTTNQWQLNTTEERRIAEAATPGPWGKQVTTACFDVIQGGDRTTDSKYLAMMGTDFNGIDASHSYDESEADADFICHARTGYPLALAVIEAAEELSGLWHHLPNDHSETAAAMQRLDGRLDAWHTGGGE